MTTGLVLAAGAGRRLGRVKPLLPWAGTTVARWTVHRLREAGCERVVVAVGHRATEVAADVGGIAETVFCDRWDEGIGQTIATAVRLLGSFDRLLLTPCDMPLVSSRSFSLLIERAPAVAVYAGTFGVPVCLTAAFRRDLTDLSGDCGAKSALRRRRDELAEVAIPEATVDLDTVTDYEAAYRRFGVEPFDAG